MAPLVTFLFLRSGLFAPSVEIIVGYAPGLDPRKAPLVFLAVDLESVVTCLPKRPLLQSADVAAVLLAIRNRLLAILRADPPGLCKVSSEGSEKYPPACAAKSLIFLHSGDIFRHPPLPDILRTDSTHLHRQHPCASDTLCFLHIQCTRHKLASCGSVQVQI